MERKTVFDYSLYFPYTLYTKKLKLKPMPTPKLKPTLAPP